MSLAQSLLKIFISMLRQWHDRITATRTSRTRPAGCGESMSWTATTWQQCRHCRVCAHTMCAAIHTNKLLVGHAPPPVVGISITFLPSFFEWHLKFILQFCIRWIINNAGYFKCVPVPLWICAILTNICDNYFCDLVHAGWVKLNILSLLPHAALKPCCIYAWLTAV